MTDRPLWHNWPLILAATAFACSLCLLSRQYLDYLEYNSTGLGFTFGQTFSNLVPQWSAQDPPFKIYIYKLSDDLDKDLRAVKLDDAEWLGQYNADIRVHALLSSSPYRTFDPEEATLFYIPIFPTRKLHVALHLEDKSWQDSSEGSANYTETALRYIQQEHPYWARKNGKDHFFTVTADHARCLHFMGLPREFFGDSFLLHHLGDFTLSNGDPDSPKHRTKQPDLWPCYVPGRDVLLPAMVNHSITPVVSPEKERSLSVIYRFSLTTPTSRHEYHGVNIRTSLKRMFDANPLAGADFREKTLEETVSDMAMSNFCATPPGVVAHTSRFFRAIFSGCIPVSFFMAYHLPFQNVIEYSQLTVNISPFDVQTTHKVLAATIGDESRMQRLRQGIAFAQQQLRWDRPDGAEASIISALRHRSREAEADMREQPVIC